MDANKNMADNRSSLIDDLKIVYEMVDLSEDDLEDSQIFLDGYMSAMRIQQSRKSVARQIFTQKVAEFVTYYRFKYLFPQITYPKVDFDGSLKTAFHLLIDDLPIVVKACNMDTKVGAECSWLFQYQTEENNECEEYIFGHDIDDKLIVCVFVHDMFSSGEIRGIIPLSELIDRDLLQYYPKENIQNTKRCLYSTGLSYHGFGRLQPVHSSVVELFDEHDLV